MKNIESLEFKNGKIIVKTKEELEKKQVKIKYVWSKGQFITRGTRNEWYYIQFKDNGLQEWEIDSNPKYDQNMTAHKTNDVNDKYWDYTGDIKPDEPYNPHKEILAHMEDFITTEANIEEIEDGYKLEFSSGDMKGTWELKESNGLWTFDKIGGKEELQENLKFSLQKHWAGDSEHWDLNLQRPGKPISEGFHRWSIKKNPTYITKEDRLLVVSDHICNDERWFDLNEDIPPGDEAPEWLRDGNWTKNFIAHVKTIDKGKYTLYNNDSRFKSFDLFGDKIEGYHILKKNNDHWFFSKSSKPGEEELIAGDPKDQPLTDIWITEDDGNYEAKLYSKRFFTSAIPKDDYDRYDLPDFPEGAEPFLMKYSKEGTVGMVRVQKVIFDQSKWEEDDALKWVKDNNISDWKQEFVKD